MYIEEYVPTITPNIIAKEKPFNIAPPNVNIDEIRGNTLHGTLSNPCLNTKNNYEQKIF